MKKFILALCLTIGIQSANAGVGAIALTVRTIHSTGNELLEMGTSSFAALTIYKGLEQVWCGNYAIGALLLVLNENDIISDEGYEMLEGAEVSTKEAFVEIMLSDLSEDEKVEEVTALFE